MRQPDVGYARNGDTALAYQVVGEGPLDLCLVFGYLSNIEFAWRLPKMAAFFERLATFSRLILMDRRGSGMSDRSSQGEPASIETEMGDLIAVLDAAGSARTTLFGIWEGCMVATMTAASSPERVASLVLFNASAAGMPKDDYPWARTAERWEEIGRTEREGWGTRARIVEALRSQAPSMIAEPDALADWLTYTRLSSNPASTEHSLRVARDTDIRQILPSVHVPTLVLHRIHDRTEHIDGGRYVAAKIPGARFVELPGEDSQPWVGDSETLLNEVQRFVTGSVSTSTPDRVLATIVFMDIASSTEKVAAVGDAAWRELVTAFRARVRQQLTTYRGREIDTAGDGFLVTFDGPARAVRCIQAIRAELAPLGIEIRTGAHAGEVEELEDGVGGIAVHVAARIAALADPDSILTSSTIKDLVAGSGLVFEDAGEHELKGVPDRWHLYRVVA